MFDRYVTKYVELPAGGVHLSWRSLGRSPRGPGPRAPATAADLLLNKKNSYCLKSHECRVHKISNLWTYIYSSDLKYFLSILSLQSRIMALIFRLTFTIVHFLRASKSSDPYYGRRGLPTLIWSALRNLSWYHSYKIFIKTMHIANIACKIYKYS